MEIQARCVTNVDKFKISDWPSVFAAIPNPGDWVASRSGGELRVVRVIHRSVTVEGKERPMIEVELNR